MTAIERIQEESAAELLSTQQLYLLNINKTIVWDQ